MTEEEKVIFREKLQAIVANYDKGKSGIDKEREALKSKIDGLSTFMESTSEEFEKQTEITRKDLSFLVFASVLQVVRQLISSKIKTRLSDKESADSTPFHNEEHSDRLTKKYYATTTEIISNPVPFDAIRKSSVVKNNGNPKINGFNHRYTALGHDPIFGIIIGTANILTKTITISEGGFNFSTYHVGSGEATNGKSIYMMDTLTNQASTSLMFEHIYKRLIEEGTKGWEALCLALGKEIVHLLSDVRTAKSLPLPGISMVSPDTSRILNLCGIDMLSASTFGLDMLISKFTDLAIAYLHSICYDPLVDGSIETYNVRTKNIIYYSSLISITSTTVQTLARAYLGDAAAIAKFDFGGAISAWKNVWETPFIISDMKSDYIRHRTCKYIGE